MVVRGPQSPEEIVSPHSMPWDWLATTGLASIAWISLVLLGLWFSFRGIDRGIDGEIKGGGSRLVLWSTIFILFAGFNLFQFRELLVLGFGVLPFRVIGWLCFIGLAIFLMWLWKRAPMGMTVGAAVAALVVVMHAQVEMTIQQTNTAPWIICLIGLAAPASCRLGGHVSRWMTGLISGWLAVGLATLVIVVGLIPASSSQSTIQSAGRIVHAASRAGKGNTLLAERTIAARILMESARAHQDDRLQRLAAEQLLAGIPMSLSLPSPPTPESVETVRQFVINISMDSFERTGSVEAGHLALSALLSRGTSADLDQALSVARLVADRDPSGIWSQRHLADVLWESGEKAQAQGVYQRVLQLDAARSIDPLRQLTRPDRELIEQRVSTQIVD